ncbi:MAG: hypothetical protein ACW97P_09425 [Candidatus Hodarchaeales archaeon]|jgi:hypothetical protein
MDNYIYCPSCECWVCEEDFDEDEQDPRCIHCGGELQSFDPDPYDTLEEKYL